MMVNAIAPYMLGGKLLPRMTDAGKMIAISSGMGSIGDNRRRLGTLPDLEGCAQHGVEQPCAGGAAARRRLRLVQPRLGEDADGRHRAPRSRAEKSVARHARADRTADHHDTGRFLRRNGSDTALVNLPAR